MSLIVLSPLSWATTIANTVLKSHSGFETSGYYSMLQGSQFADAGRLSKAEALLKYANEQLPQSVINTFSYASVLYDEANATSSPQAKIEKLKQAQWMFRRVTNLNPEFVLGYYKLSETSWDLQQYDAIVTYLKEGLEVNPDDVLMHYSLGLAYEKLNLANEAMVQYQWVLANNPHFSPAYYSLGSLLESQSRSNDAINLYKTAIKNQPDQNGYRLALADVYVTSEQYKSAEAILMDALSRDSQNYLIYVGLGHLYFTQSDFEKALTMYESAKKLEPQNTEVVYYISLSMSHLTKQQNSKTALQKASR